MLQPVQSAMSLKSEILVVCQDFSSDLCHKFMNVFLKGIEINGSYRMISPEELFH